MKQFKGNPALGFISTAAEETAKEETSKAAKVELPKERPAEKEIQAKKEEAPAAREKAPETVPAANEPAYKRQPVKAEAKSKRVNLVIQPSLYTAAKKKTKKEGKSLNQYIIDLIVKDLG